MAQQTIGIGTTANDGAGDVPRVVANKINANFGEVYTSLVNKAPLADAALTGTPTAPTATLTDNTTKIATTAFVKGQAYLTTAPVTSVAGKTGTVTLAAGDLTATGTKDATTFLRGDNTWAVPSGSTAIIRPPYRPENYGAAVNGSTNDTTAWTNMLSALNAAGGGEVRVPSGTSLLNAGIVLPQRCTIRGNGRDTTTIRRASNSNSAPFLTATGADSPTRHFALALEDMTINGGDGTTPAFRSIYASEHHFRNVKFFGNLGPAMQLVENWDSNYDFVFAEWCGQGGALATDNASTVGDDVIQLWAGIAASGSGSSFDSCNNLNFNNLRVETFKSPALSLRKGASGAGVGIHQIRFNGCKIESGSTLASPYMIGFSADTRNVLFRDIYLAIISVTGTAATAGTARMVDFVPHSGCMFSGGTAYLASNQAAKLNSIFSCFTNAQNRIERIWLDGVGPSGGTNPAIIKIAGGSNVPYAQVETNPGTTANSTYPVYAATA